MAKPKANGDNWRTPAYVFRWAQEHFAPGGFDVDLAASADNALCEFYYSLDGTNGLMADWAHPHPNHRGWCNPPYSNIYPWICKAVREAERGFTTVMLMPTFNGDGRDSFVFEYATSIVFITGEIVIASDLKITKAISGRIAFEGDDGNPVSGGERGSMLVRFGPAAQGLVVDYVPRPEMLMDRP